MYVSARVSVFFAAIFAVVCFAVAITGFTSAGGLVDPAQKSDAWGFAWFWTFLGLVGVVFGGVGVWIARTHKESEDAR